jgi:hypothetical protein
MWRFTEKNLAAQAFDSALIWKPEYREKINWIIDSWKDNKWEKDKWITNIKNVLLLVDNTTEKSTASDLMELKWAFKKLEWLLGKTKEEIAKIKDPVLKEQLQQLKQGKESWEYEQRKTAIINFFNLFKTKAPTDPDYKINIDDFSNFINLWYKEEETKKSVLEWFSQEFQTAYNRQNPENKKIKEQWRTIRELGDAEHEKESEEADTLLASLETRESTTEISRWQST